MSDFKIGDIVKYVDSSLGYWHLYRGSLYKIVNIDDGILDPLVTVETMNGERIECGRFAYRFEKVDLHKDNPFDYFCNIQLLHGVKALKLTVCDSGHEIRIFNDLTPEGGKRIELWNVVTYHNDKCEIADENMRKAIECACKIYDMVFA